MSDDAVKLQPVYFILHEKLSLFVGKRNPSYAIVTGSKQPDAHWWAKSQLAAKTWTSLDGVRRFRSMYQKNSEHLDEFIVVGTDGSSVPLVSV